ncbi:MAG: hypothetical protein ACLSAP_04395 [Oscillospiraceae bacterium]
MCLEITCKSINIKRKGVLYEKLMSLLLAAALCLGLFAGCANNQNGGSDKKLKIGVVQIVEHLSLNTIRDSFAEQLKALGYVDGENCTLNTKAQATRPR